MRYITAHMRSFWLICDLFTLCDPPRWIPVINNEHTEEQSIFSCCYCGKKFYVLHMYITYLQAHTQPKYKCHVCNEIFPSMTSLRLHSKEHINQCPFCSRTFTSRAEAKRHTDKDHGQALDADTKQCLYCDQTFSTVEEVMAHSKMHRKFCVVARSAV